MEYSVYWSILDTPSKTIQSNSVFLCIALLAALFWVWTKKAKKHNSGSERTVILWATGTFTILGLGLYLMLTFVYHDKSREKTLELLNSPATSKVEGVVSNFKRTYRYSRYGHQTNENFTVDSIHFAYSDAVLGRFNSFSEAGNGVIFNGQKVRITYRSLYGSNDKEILRLEIAR